MVDCRDGGILEVGIGVAGSVEGTVIWWQVWGGGVEVAGVGRYGLGEWVELTVAGRRAQERRRGHEWVQTVNAVRALSALDG